MCKSQSAKAMYSKLEFEEVQTAVRIKKVKKIKRVRVKRGNLRFFSIKKSYILKFLEATQTYAILKKIRR